MEEEFIVKGAMATCQFGVAPAMLNNIMDNMNVYFNGKLAATSMTMGPVFPAPAFGTCNMVPNMPKPCVAMITKWDNVYSGMYINRISNPLTKNSKGTCALGCPMCISFQTTGQIPIPTVPQMEMAAYEHQSDMNLLAIDDLEDEELEDDELDIDTIAKIVKEKGSTKDEAIVFKFKGQNAQQNKLKSKLNEKDIVFEELTESDGSTTILITKVKDDEEENDEIKNASETKLRPDKNGHWKDGDDSKGNSIWIPNGDHVLGKFNPEKETWDNNIRANTEMIINIHRNLHGKQGLHLEGIKYKDDEPDFKPMSFGTVKLNAFSSNRDVNFAMANEAMARQLSKSKDRQYTAKEVDKWMKNNQYGIPFTWHETPEGEVLKVPSVLHGNASHTGGVNAMKREGIEAYNTSTKNQSKKAIQRRSNDD